LLVVLQSDFPRFFPSIVLICVKLQFGFPYTTLSTLEYECEY